MKDIFGMVGKFLGLIFAAVIILYTSMLAFQLAGRIIPGNPIAQAMTLVLFDIAALVWFVQFITQAKGTIQWAVAGIGFAVGLAGSVIMAAGELVLGQSLVEIADPTRIGWILIATNVIAALAHAVLTYVFHFADPAVMGRIENAQEVSRAIDHAYSDVRAEIARNVDSLTADLKQSVMFEATQQIRLLTASHLRAGVDTEDKSPIILNANAREVEVSGDGDKASPFYVPAPTRRPGVMERVRNGLNFRQRRARPRSAEPVCWKCGDLPLGTVHDGGKPICQKCLATMTVENSKGQVAGGLDAMTLIDAVLKLGQFYPADPGVTAAVHPSPAPVVYSATVGAPPSVVEPTKAAEEAAQAGPLSGE